MKLRVMEELEILCQGKRLRGDFNTVAIFKYLKDYLRKEGTDLFYEELIVDSLLVPRKKMLCNHTF